MLICWISLLLNSEKFNLERVEVSQVLEYNKFSYKIVYKLPSNAKQHYFNRGVAYVQRDRCVIKK